MNNLSTTEWNTIFALPADGQPYNVPGIAFRAIHKPRTAMHAEQVIAETQFGTLRRIKSGDKWKPADHIAGAVK